MKFLPGLIMNEEYRQKRNCSHYSSSFLFLKQLIYSFKFTLLYPALTLDNKPGKQLHRKQIWDKS